MAPRTPALPIAPRRSRRTPVRGLLVAGVGGLLLASPLTAVAPSVAAPPTSALSGILTGSAPAPAYTPRTGARFNNPLGDATAKRRLLQQIISTVDSAPARSSVRMAVYSFADPATADALLRAYRRGVKVKLVFSSTHVYAAMTRLQQAIGKNPHADSFVVFCDASCRGERGEMHAKYFAFNRAGSARWITMVGSVNVTRFNADEQWSDLYTVTDDKAYFLAYRPWFTQLKYDVPVADPYVTRISGQTDVDITPLDLGTTPDPVLAALDKVQCDVAMSAIDPAATHPDTMVHTKVLIAAHAWNGERGKRVAREVAGLNRSGCRVKVFYGVGMGGAVNAILRDGGVTRRNGTHRGVHTHEKMMIVDGGFDGVPSTVRAWTGSHNWSDRALARDDLFVQINDEAIAQHYGEQFMHMWEQG